MTFSTRLEWLFVVCGVSLGGLPVLGNLVESSEEVRGSEIFVSRISIMTSTRIVEEVFLAERNMMSVMSTVVMRPVLFVSVSCVRIELVKLITVWSAVLGRGSEEMPKLSLLLGLLRARRERRRG